MKDSNFNFLRVMLAAFASASLMMLTACGSSNSNGTPPPPPPAVVPPQPPCNGNNCVYQAPNAMKGFYAQSANFPSNFMNNGSSLQVSGNVTSILEQAMGVCNRGAYNGGLADCQTWVGGIYDLVFLVNPQNTNQVSVIFRAYPQVNQQGWYTYQLPTAQNFFLSLLGWPVAQNPAGTFNPMILQSTINPVNNSQGFEIRSYGPQVSAGYNKLLQLQVANGKIEDQSFNFQLFWNGAQIATGTLVKCQSPTCGL